MRNLITILVGFQSLIAFTQSNDSIAPSTNYLDDQLYIGITYNTLNELPNGIEQNGFSNGIFLGYIKDMPINAQRNFGFGIGVGYGRNTYFQDLKIEVENGLTTFEEVRSFDRNKFSFHAVEIPFEIRWRTSTVKKYKFWRVYTGMKLGYVFASNAKLKKDNNTVRVRGVEGINKFQYGFTLGTGYGTWNLNVYYGLSDLFSPAALTNRTNTPVRGRDLRIGLIFYIL